MAIQGVYDVTSFRWLNKSSKIKIQERVFTNQKNLNEIKLITLGVN